MKAAYVVVALLWVGLLLLGWLRTQPEPGGTEETPAATVTVTPTATPSGKDRHGGLSRCCKEGRVDGLASTGY